MKFYIIETDRAEVNRRPKAFCHAETSRSRASGKLSHGPTA